MNMLMKPQPGKLEIENEILLAPQSEGNGCAGREVLDCSQSGEKGETKVDDVPKGIVHYVAL